MLKALFPFELLRHLKFVDLGLCDNSWIWAHILGSALLVRFFRTRVSSAATLAWISLIAVLWELYEIYRDTPNLIEVSRIYGSTERYLYDTSGDIFAALAIAVIMLWKGDTWKGITRK